MDADTGTDTHDRPTATRPLAFARAGVLAVVLSIADNALLLCVVLVSDVLGPFLALSHSPVLFVSAVGAVGATVVLVLSFLPNVWVLVSDPAATLGVVLVLMTMHVVVAVATVGALTRT